MKAKVTPAKDMNVVYRKDGRTPDMRYKSSRAFVFAQYEEKHKDRSTADARTKRFRDHASSRNTEMTNLHPVQIKPVGKKPVWKVAN